MNWYMEECKATFEKGSGCASNDYCVSWDNEYSKETIHRYDSDYVMIGGEG